MRDSRVRESILSRCWSSAFVSALDRLLLLLLVMLGSLLCPFHSCPVWTLIILPGLFHLTLSVLSRLFLDCALLAICLGALCPTIDPSCWLSKPPYLLISSLLESQTHSGSRFSNNQSSGRAEQWEMEGFDCVSVGGVSGRQCYIAAKKVSSSLTHFNSLRTLASPSAWLDLSPRNRATCVFLPLSVAATDFNKKASFPGSDILLCTNF